MSALGHTIEEEGIATVAIALVRPQAERTRPPRALWVPFELGRPFGPPSDPAWRPPFMPAAVANGLAESLASRLEEEVLLLHGAHQRWMAQHGRSTIGLSGLAIAEAVRYVADWLRGKKPPSPRDGFSAPLILRFAVDAVILPPV